MSLQQKGVMTPDGSGPQETNNFTLKFQGAREFKALCQTRAKLDRRISTKGQIQICSKEGHQRRSMQKLRGSSLEEFLFLWKSLIVASILTLYSLEELYIGGKLGQTYV